MYTQNELKAILAEKTNYHFSELDMDEFNNMWESQKYPSKIVGSSFIGGAQETISQLQAGDTIDLEDEPNNPYDSNAIACYYKGRKLGYIPKEQTSFFKDFYSRKAKVFKVVGELKQGFNVGCIIRVQIDKIGEIIMHQFGGFSYGTCWIWYTPTFKFKGFRKYISAIW